MAFTITRDDMVAALELLGIRVDTCSQVVFDKDGVTLSRYAHDPVRNTRFFDEMTGNAQMLEPVFIPYDN